MSSAGSRFRAALAERPLQVAGVINAYAALLAQRAGFRAIYLSGAGVAKYAPNKANAIKFLEYLASAEAQGYFAKGNYEFPVIANVGLHPVIQSWAEFKEDQINAAVFGRNNEAALKLMDRAGWK